MLKQCLAVVALSAVPVGYSLTLCAAPSALPSRLPGNADLSERRVAVPAAQPQPPASRSVKPDQPIHEQMRVFDRTAKVDMLLYTGHFAPVHHASITHLRHVTALSLPRLGAPD